MRILFPKKTHLYFMKKIITTVLLCWLAFAPFGDAQTMNIQKATFAGGCFWCMEKPFDEINGVISTTSGYSGGHVDNPTYKQVSNGKTGHAEVVQIEYDADKVSYDELLEVFWKNIDPTVKNRQFCDVGSQYRSGIFYHNEEQKKLAEQTQKEIEQKLNKEIFTQITPISEFYPAEQYHQDYYKKNPIRYQYYRFACGRDKRLEEVWGNG